MIFTLVNALVDAIFALAAYRYATTGRRDVFLGDPSYAEHAFVAAKHKTDEAAALGISTFDSPSVIVDDPAK